MQRTELIIGGCLIAIGILPVSSMIVYGLPEPHPTSCRPQLVGCKASETGGAQFRDFWYFISIFLLGIGGWFVVAGIKSRAIVSKRHPK